MQFLMFESSLDYIFRSVGFTAKSVKQIGVDKLRKMMKKAEDDYDKDMNIQEEQQMEDAPSDVMSAAYGGLLKNPYK